MSLHIRILQIARQLWRIVMSTIDSQRLYTHISRVRPYPTTKHPCNFNKFSIDYENRLYTNQSYISIIHKKWKVLPTYVQHWIVYLPKFILINFKLYFGITNKFKNGTGASRRSHLLSLIIMHIWQMRFSLRRNCRLHHKLESHVIFEGDKKTCW